jgi:hypothetical protein
MRFSRASALFFEDETGPASDQTVDRPVALRAFLQGGSFEVNKVICINFLMHIMCQSDAKAAGPTPPWPQLKPPGA